MYRRYEPSPQRRQNDGSLSQVQSAPVNGRNNVRRQNPVAHNTGTQHYNSPNNRYPNGHHNRPNSGSARPVPQSEHKAKGTRSERKTHPLTKLIPQSIYNPDTGKILGFLSAEDLLIAALILLLIDSGDEESDNSMLIYALLYILISEHIELPF